MTGLEIAGVLRQQMNADHYCAFMSLPIKFRLPLERAVLFFSSLSRAASEKVKLCKFYRVPP